MFHFRLLVSEPSSPPDSALPDVSISNVSQLPSITTFVTSTIANPSHSFQYTATPPFRPDQINDTSFQNSQTYSHYPDILSNSEPSHSCHTYTNPAYSVPNASHIMTPSTTSNSVFLHVPIPISKSKKKRLRKRNK